MYEQDIHNKNFAFGVIQVYIYFTMHLKSIRQSIITMYIKICMKASVHKNMYEGMRVHASLRVCLICVQLCISEQLRCYYLC